jgi:hypothetical protein
MSDIIFIQENYLKEVAAINDNVDFKMLKPTIIMCQDIYLQQVLGTPLFEDLKTKITANPSLSSYANEKLLIDKYISKYLAWVIKMEATLEFKFKYSNIGVVVKSGENNASAETSDLKMLMDGCRIKSEKYSELLTDYLKNNTTLFPKYYEYSITGLKPTNNNFFKGLMIRGYDEKLTNDSGDIC